MSRPGAAPSSRRKTSVWVTYPEHNMSWGWVNKNIGKEGPGAWGRLGEISAAS
jgi:hypothetical protein